MDLALFRNDMDYNNDKDYHADQQQDGSAWRSAVSRQRKDHDPTIPVETKKAKNLRHGLFPIIQIYLAKRMGSNTIH